MLFFHAEPPFYEPYINEKSLSNFVRFICDLFVIYLRQPLTPRIRTYSVVSNQGGSVNSSAIFKAMRAESGLSIDEAANELNICPADIFKIESGILWAGDVFNPRESVGVGDTFRVNIENSYLFVVTLQRETVAKQVPSIPEEDRRIYYGWNGREYKGFVERARREG